MLPLPFVVDLVIFGFWEKKREGLKSSAYVATANYSRAPSRSSKKINDGRYNGMLLMLSQNKRNRLSLYMVRTLCSLRFLR